MGERKTIFTDEDPKRILNTADVIVERTFDFGDAGYAATVNALPDNDLHVYAGVTSVESAEIEFELLNVPHVNEERVAEYAEIHRFHSFNDEDPTGEGVTIVATDTGVDPTHEVFDGHEVNFHDVTGSGRGDQVGHGTAVLGQIAQFAPDAELEMVRMFGSEGRTDMESVLATYEYLFANADRIDVVNMSWGTNTKVQQIDDLQNRLVEKGVRPVTAAGNTGDRGGSPATAENAFSVGAATVRGKLAPFSSYNPNRDNPDITAVGVNNKLASASKGTMGNRVEEGWVSASGTSFASPIVAAAVGRYIERYERSTVVESFEETADNILDTPEDGEGLLNYEAAVGSGEEPYTEKTNSRVWSLWNNGNDMVYMEADWLGNGKYTAKLQSEDEDGVTVRFEERDEAGN